MSRAERREQRARHAEYEAWLSAQAKEARTVLDDEYGKPAHEQNVGGRRYTAQGRLDAIEAVRKGKLYDEGFRWRWAYIGEGSDQYREAWREAMFSAVENANMRGVPLKVTGVAPAASSLKKVGIVAVCVVAALLLLRASEIRTSDPTVRGLRISGKSYGPAADADAQMLTKVRLLACRVPGGFWSGLVGLDPPVAVNLAGTQQNGRKFYGSVNCESGAVYHSDGIGP